ncbi:hypothetical protein [Succinivibrio dextrinosolvens]|uniref:hypothetical protein n=1 Tax=Succinivibrio dextrinosolvens TaxID=83771 RepID=UPI00241D9E03|nr:hypothetical protein [Succinivibrio dextrinosolvens]MBE6422824.1 hypothetical protein [Succinivibrio dextrinosolvens]
MKELVIFADWEFFQCLHHIGKLSLVDELPYKCVLLEDLFHEETPYSKQAQLVDEIITLSNVIIDEPKNRYSNNIYDPNSEIKLIDQYALILGLEYKEYLPNSVINICTKIDALANEYIELFDVNGFFSQSLIYKLKQSSILSSNEILDIIDFVISEKLRSEENEEYIYLLKARL